MAGVSAAADKRSVILLWQPGGPSHLDMWDMKPDAPIEYRGEFTSIPSDIPGYRVSELMPKLSQMCNKLAILRSSCRGCNRHCRDAWYSPFRRRSISR